MSYRDDDVDKGHFREFIQCDADVVGAKDLSSDAEVVLMAHDGLEKFGFDDYTIRINHRKIIESLAEKAGIHGKDGFLEVQRAIDDADKII
jgi:histidyl-tRNA synthetase